MTKDEKDLSRALVGWFNYTRPACKEVTIFIGRGIMIQYDQFDEIWRASAGLKGDSDVQYTVGPA